MVVIAYRRTPQYAWPLLKSRTGVEVAVKHESYTPIGSFKVRGGSSISTGRNLNVRKCEESSPRPVAITASRWR